MTVETLTRKSDVLSLDMCIIKAVKLNKPWGKYANGDNAIHCFLRKVKINVERLDCMTDAQWVLVQRIIAVSPNDRPNVADVLPALERFARTERRQARAAAAVCAPFISDACERLHAPVMYHSW
jgi:hypothetical protein